MKNNQLSLTKMTPLSSRCNSVPKFFMILELILICASAKDLCLNVKVSVQDTDRPAQDVPVTGYLLSDCEWKRVLFDEPGYACSIFCPVHFECKQVGGINECFITEGEDVKIREGRMVSSSCETDPEGMCQLCFEYNTTLNYKLVVLANVNFSSMILERSYAQNYVYKPNWAEAAFYGLLFNERYSSFWDDTEINLQSQFFNNMDDAPEVIDLQIKERRVWVQVRVFDNAGNPMEEVDAEISPDGESFTSMPKCKGEECVCWDCTLPQGSAPPSFSVAEKPVTFGNYLVRVKRVGMIFAEKQFELNQILPIEAGMAGCYNVWRKYGRNGYCYIITFNYTPVLMIGEGISSMDRTEKKLKSVCGNMICEDGENYENCCLDCGCPSGKSCVSGECVEEPKLNLMFVPVNWETREIGLFEKILNFLTGKKEIDFESAVDKQAEVFLESTGLNSCMDKIRILKHKTNCEVNLSMTSNKGRHEVLKNITNCLSKNPVPDNWRIIGLTDKSIPGALGYTCRVCRTVIANISRDEVSAHELGHTYGLCDEYNYTIWHDSDLEDPCPNAFPDYCSKNETEWCEGEICGDTCRCIMGVPLDKSINQEFGPNCKSHLEVEITCE